MPRCSPAVDSGCRQCPWSITSIDRVVSSIPGPGSVPQRQLDRTRLLGAVGVQYRVNRGLVHGEHDICGLLVGQAQRCEPCGQLVADHRELSGVGRPAAVDELDLPRFHASRLATHRGAVNAALDGWPGLRQPSRVRRLPRHRGLGPRRRAAGRAPADPPRSTRVSRAPAPPTRRPGAAAARSLPRCPSRHGITGMIERSVSN